MSAPQKVHRTIAEINEKIRQGKAVVLNASEMTSLVRKEGKVKAALQVDVVTTGTFSPMCSSGLFFNIGQQPPTIKTSKVWLNGVPSYAGIAAVDAYIGATEPHGRGSPQQGLPRTVHVRRRARHRGPGQGQARAPQGRGLRHGLLTRARPSKRKFP